MSWLVRNEVQNRAALVSVAAGMLVAGLPADAGAGGLFPPLPARSAIVAVVDGRHADAALEAMLPTSLGGSTLVAESQRGTELSTRSAAFDAFLRKLGKTRADFTVASARGPSGLRAQVGAWSVAGADPALLLPAFRDAVQASSTTPLAQADETLAGRAVARIGDPGQLAQGPLYAVVHGSALFFVQTPDRALAEEAIGKMPR